VNQEDKERRFQRIYQIGCICSRKRGWRAEADIHHLNLDEHAGQKRLGDEYTIGLSPWFHRGIPVNGMNAAQCTKLLGPSMKLEPVRFREVFGTDEELLAEQNRLIDEWDECALGSAKGVANVAK